jgi:5'-3' exonuclease
MGIRNLNRYLLENCTTAITNHPLHNFAGKRVVIDTSIYLYRFIGDGALIPQLYAMISVLLSNHVIPIFIFDGKAPIEKMDVLRQRQFEKAEAREKYEILQKRLETEVVEPVLAEMMQREMDILKRQMIRVTEEHTSQAKELMDAKFGN